MKTNVGFPQVKAIIPLIVILITACSSGPALVPITPAEIPVPPGAKEITAANALSMGGIFFPWGMDGGVFTEGPFSGYKIVTSNDDGTLTGYNIYTILSFNFNNLKTFYETELEKSGWEKADDLNVNDYKGFAWTGGKQVFLVFIMEIGNEGYAYTFLLNK